MPRVSRWVVAVLFLWLGRGAIARAAEQRVPVLIGVRPAAEAPRVEQTALRAVRAQRLRETAAVAEAGVLARLTRAVQDGEAGAVHGFWLAPIVAAEVSPRLRDELARRADVRWVRDDVGVQTLTTPRRATVHVDPLWSPRGVTGVDEAARVYGLDGSGVRVCILDSGVDISHPDLAGKMVTRNPSDPTYPGGWMTFGADGARDAHPLPPYDSDVHGTHVSGVALGGATSGVAIGVAPGAALMAGLVTPRGEGRLMQIIGGLEWSADPDDDPLTDDGAHVVNLSLGTADTVSALIEPVRTLRTLGAVVIGAMGNSPSSLAAPANIPDCIGAGATDASGEVAPYSARGWVTWHHAPYDGVYAKPDLVAPGTDIYSTVPGGGYSITSGTSESAPFLAGVVALMREANPAIAPDSVRAILVRTARDIAPAGADIASGGGEVDAYAAVTAAYAGRPWFSGVVRDAVSGAPLAGASLTVQSDGSTFTLRSLADGGFAVRPPAAMMTYEVSAYGYAPLTATVTLPLDVPQTLDLALTPLPTAVVSGRAIDALSRTGVAATLEMLHGGLVAATWQCDATGGFIATVPVGIDSIRVVPPAPYDTLFAAISVPAEGVSDLRLALTHPELLVVDAADFPDYADLYAAALAAGGHRFVLTYTRPDVATLLHYGKVLWFTGDATINTFSPDDQAAMESYLAQGGRALVMGKGVAKEFVVDPFLGRVLRATAAADISAPSSVRAASGDTLFTGFTATIVPQPGGPAERPSALVPVAPASVSLVYGGSGSANGAVAAIAADLGAEASGARLVFAGFGLEEMPSTDEQVALLDGALGWLELAPVPSGTPLRDTDDDATPLPLAITVRAANTPIDTTAVLVHYSVNAGAEIALALTRGDDGSFHGAIPPQPLGSRVRYRVSVADTGGRVGYWPFAFEANGDPSTYAMQVVADSLAPSVRHQPLYQTAEVTGPFVLGLHAADDRGLGAVSAVWRWHSADAWSETAATAVSGDSFAVSVPGPASPGDTLFYQLRAVDASRRANSTMQPALGQYALRVVSTLAWDFESDDGAFAVGGRDWQWGTPLSPAIGEGYAVCPHSGTKVWATSLRFGYSSYTSSTLTLPAVHLPADRTAASLRFWHCYDFDGTPPALLDGGTVQISTDGVHYATLFPASGYDGVVAQSTPGIGGQYAFGGTQALWRPMAFSLAAYVGQTVRIRFLEGAHLGGSGTGWFLDDVRIDWATQDDIAPELSVALQPLSSPDTVGTRTLDVIAGDGEGALAGVTAHYSTDGWRTTHTIAATPFGSPGGMRVVLPAQRRGTRVDWYVVASDVAGNQRRLPLGDSTRSYRVLPSAPAVEWWPVSPPSVPPVTVRAMCPVPSPAPCNLSPVACPAGDGVTQLSPDADVWDEARFGVLPAALLAEYRVVALDGAASGAVRALGVLDSLARTDSLRAPGVLLLASAGTTGAADSTVTAYVLAHTGAVRSAVRPQRTVTWCTAPDSLWSAALSGSAVAAVTPMRPGAGTRVLLRDCTEGDSVALGAAGRGDFPRVVALALSPYALQATHARGVVDPLLRWLRGPARVAWPTLPNIEDTQGPYRVRVLAWAPAGVDTASLSLSVATPPQDPIGHAIALSPGPGFDTYTATLPGVPAGTTMQLALLGRDRAGAPLPAAGRSFQVIVDTVAPAIVVPAMASVRPGSPPQIAIAASDSGTGVDSVAVLWQFRPPGMSGWSATVRTDARVTGGDFVATLPAQPAGQRVRYRVRVTDRARRQNITHVPGATSWREFGAVPSAPTLLAADRGAWDSAVHLADSLSARGTATDLWLAAATTPLASVPLTEYAHVVLEAGTAFADEDAAAVRAALREAVGPLSMVFAIRAAADSGAAWRLAADAFAARPGIAGVADSARGLPGAPDGGFPLAPRVRPAILPTGTEPTAAVVTRAADAGGRPLAVAARPRAGLATLVTTLEAEAWAARTSGGDAFGALLHGLDSLAAQPTAHFAALRLLPPRATPGPAPVALRLEIPGGEGEQPVVQVEAFDARGRRVREVWNGPLLAGLRALIWDGADAHGRAVPQGVYWLRARSGGAQSTTRAVVVGR